MTTNFFLKGHPNKLDYRQSVLAALKLRYFHLADSGSSNKTLICAPYDLGIHKENQNTSFVVAERNWEF